MQLATMAIVSSTFRSAECFDVCLGAILLQAILQIAIAKSPSNRTMIVFGCFLGVGLLASHK